MTLKRFFRFAVIGGAVAAGVAAARALTRTKDPLPAPADGPSEPWPPLRTAAAPDKVEAPGVSEPEPLVDATDEEAEVEAESETETTGETETEPTKRRRTRPLRATWMPPNEDGSCPDGYPLKANDQSMIFHAPGQMSYDRTIPERCYADAEAAVADGYRAAKR